MFIFVFSLKERRIWIVITIILAFTALCFTLLVMRCILFKKYESKSRLNKEEDSQGTHFTYSVIYCNVSPPDVAHLVCKVASAYSQDSQARDLSMFKIVHGI